jgi:hypothetical protein
VLDIWPDQSSHSSLMASEDYVFSAEWPAFNGEAPKPSRGLFYLGRLSWRPRHFDWQLSLSPVGTILIPTLS